ncbi:MAG TPA: hypothetical protein VE964_10320 [Myxococcales bacterium]|nr:hypothetical protein [Myxococcales bacterium]
MSAAGRQDRALLLAGVALLGLVVTPLLHAEEHWLEEHEDEAEAAALAEAWRAGSSDPLEALAFALAHVHELNRQGPRDGHPPSHHHSHGPAGAGPHGAGAIAHLGVALHASPALPDLALPAPEHAAPALITAQLRGTLAYLVPEWSQGPPLDC